MITLNASADYGLSGQYIARISGRDSKYTFNRDFIGRRCGKRNESTNADVDDPGLYECCDVDRNGKKSRFYFVVEVDGDLFKFTTDKEDAMTVAKMMDDGRAFSEIVVGTKADDEALAVKNEIEFLKTLLIVEGSPELPITLTQKVGNFAAGAVVAKNELQPVVRSEIDRLTQRLEALRSSKKYPTSFYEIVKNKKQAAQTISTALDKCWAILQALPPQDGKKVLSELKKLMTPKKDKGEGE
jgi:hypothetical protein